jgi:hypothetical protein
MPALTTQQKYDAVNVAIDTYTAGGSVYSFNLGDMSVTYRSDQIEQLTRLRDKFAHDLTMRNIRKRVTPDFSGGNGSSASSLINPP